MNNKIFDNIYLDLDGVMVDFIRPAFQLFKVSLKTCSSVEDLIEHYIGTDEFWAKVHKQGSKWWANLPPTTWHKKLWKMAHEYANEVHILTSPSNNPSCAAGKFEWCQKHLNTIPIICKPKHKLANPTSLLIDDRYDKLSKFRSAGGHIFHWDIHHNAWADEKMLIKRADQLIVTLGNQLED